MSDSRLQPANPNDSPFHIEPEKAGFEKMCKQNGFRFWWASELAVLLGYSSPETFFRSAVQKAMTVLVQLQIDLTENIVQVSERDGKPQRDFKLSRFACYLVAMNGDSKKKEVAQAQAYFAAFATAIQTYLEQGESVERVHIRGEVSERERSLSGVVHSAGVTNFAYFQNAGYRGLYNMDIWKIRTMKNIPDGRSLLDFMGREELAANLFRITQTEAKIKNENIRGQSRLEVTAENVGKKVRAAIAEIGGNMPEELLPCSDIKQVKKNLKKAHKGFKTFDGGKQNKKKLK